MKKSIKIIIIICIFLGSLISTGIVKIQSEKYRQNESQHIRNQEIVNNLTKFSPERRKQVFDFVRFLAQQHQAEVVQQQGSPNQRIPDLDRGAVLSISEDFDAPLIE